MDSRVHWARWLSVAAVVACAYGLGSQLAFAWFAAVGLNASFFPAAGVTIGAMIVLERRDWPAVIAGAALAELVVDLAHGIPLAATLGYVLANLVQPTVGATMLRRYRSPLDMSRLADLTAFLLIAVLFASFVGAVIGATNNTLVHGGDDWFRFLSQWWVGDGLGVLVVAGTIVALWSGSQAITRRRAWEPVALIGTAAVITLAAFALDWYVLLYLPLVMLFLIAVRLGTAGVALSGALVAFIAAEATARGNRLWVLMEVDDDIGLLYLQLALMVVIASALVVAAGLAERELSTAAYTIAEASRREADLARRRAEMLGALAEELVQAATPSQIAQALAQRGLQDAWPRDAPFPSVDAPSGDLSDAIERIPNEVTSHRSVHDSARRMTRDALYRVRLVANERRARERAELLEQDTANLARFGELLDRFTTVRDRAQCVADELVRLGAASVEIELTDGRRISTGSVPVSGAVEDLPMFARGELVGRARVAGGDILNERWHVVRDIVARAAIAIDNAQLYEDERDASHRLQLGLLDFSTPDVADVRIDVAYRPGTSTLEVGGDWHDAFRLPNGSLGLVVGDVVGHGLDAAAAMAQLRGAVRALAAVSSPAELLTRLDAFVDSLPAAFMTTLVYVELDPATGAMKYACAGHPPPLIVSAGGETRLLWDARSAPLGSQFEAERIESSSRLEDGERLVLYTDGLVERRYEDIDTGLARLIDTSQHDVATADFVNRLCNEMVVGDTADDDVCVLAVALVRERTFVRFCPPRAEELAPLRRDMRTWLNAIGCPDTTAADIVLATSEAAANAIEHGSADHGRGVAVIGRFSGDVLSIVVRDHGRWRPPGPPSNRGRGLLIMRELMDRVDVEQGEGGTVVRLEVSLSTAGAPVVPADAFTP